MIKDGSGEISLKYFDWDVSNTSSSDTLSLWTSIVEATVESDVILRYTIYSDAGGGDLDRRYNDQIVLSKGTFAGITGQYLIPTNKLVKEASVVVGGDKKGCGYLFLTYTINLTFDSSSVLTNAVMTKTTYNESFASTWFLPTNYNNMENISFTPTHDMHPATKKYVDDRTIVRKNPINSYTDLDSVNSFTPFYCTRLEAETGIDSEDLDKLKYIEMTTTQVKGFGTCLEQILYVINEDHYYIRINTGSWDNWLKISSPTVTEQYVDQKISDLISKDINYNVDYRGGTYYFNYNDATGWYESNNKNVDGSTAESWLTFFQDIDEGDLTIEYEVSSETNYDKLKIMIGDVQYTEISGIQSGTISQHIASGTDIKFTYTKDSSSSRNNDMARFRVVKNDIKSMIAEAAGNALATDTLYEDSTGSTGTVYLSQSASDYEKIEIFFKDSFNRDCCKSVTTLPLNS